MVTSKHLRWQLALSIAALALLCSDPAIAAMLCPRAIACIRHEQTVSTGAEQGEHVTAARSCCPLHRNAPSRPPIDAANCCAWSAADSSVPTASFNAQRCRANDVVAQLPSGLVPPVARKAASSPAFGESELLGIKPVNQKKTDLRI